MLALLAFYLLPLVSGYFITSQLGLPTLLARWIMIWSIGSCQLVGTLEVLSLFHSVDGASLWTANAVVTAVVLLLYFRKGTISLKGEFREAYRGWNQIDLFARIILLCLFAAALLALISGVLLFPNGDPYHFNMPLFWKHQHGLLPGPAHDPRINGVVFASEAISFPGVLFANTGTLYVVFGWIAGCLTLVVSGAITRQLGASWKTTACLVAAALACAPFAAALSTGKAEMTLSTMWLLSSIYLALLAYHGTTNQGILIGSSVFCFVLSAGAKNVSLLHTPAYGLAALILFRSSLFRWTNLKAIAIGAACGALLSGLIWSYVVNTVWYGDPKGHPFLKSTLAQSFSPRAVWTRFCRGGVTFALDVVWLPNRLLPSFADLSHKSVEVLGGLPVLPEDSEFFSFDSESVRPGKGIGIVGPLILIPGTLMVLAFVPLGRTSRPMTALLVFSLISAATFLILLRWQCIGISRLMLTCYLAAFPLCARWLEKRWVYQFTLVTSVLALASCSIWTMGVLARRVDPHGNTLMGRGVAKIQRNRSWPLTFHWTGEAPESVVFSEDYTRREVYESLLLRIPNPAVIGCIGGVNAEFYGLFGRKFQNRLIPLNDCRNQEAIFNPSPDVQFIALEDFPDEFLNQEPLPGFERWLSVHEEKRTVFVCWKRKFGDAITQ